MTADDDVLFSRRGPILRITINRPQRRNALTDRVFHLMTDALVAAPKDGTTRAIVITGAGDRSFCAGADLTPGDTPFVPDYSQLSTPFANLLRAAVNCDLPLIARVNGYCFAGGMGIFGICDLAVAADTASFGLPEAKIGIFPMQVLAVLRDILPARVLQELCYTAKPLSAIRMLELGTLNAVAPADKLDEAVDSLTNTIVGNSPAAIRRGKYALRAIAGMSFQQMMSFTETALTSMIMTEDAKEGLRAFNERRPPQWKDR
ncbi:enoyl-CoA hydratase-related protein [Bradyrhizobium sp. LHD-71]|uniref:enoyl-CoA hydratase-related protein n=1 Tax=Bradyrhizobium sp. LHD-71 TaxID=3072141 RepID=UPI00280FDDB1|nr:enoyl-CoA hydratase-related protein [Bradyrhizobium sp. LHD-71]MDQ8728237.1 enoyl-CoA hydratase-related protein [Bradyrhizobium sp. LHD-71]